MTYSVLKPRGTFALKAAGDLAYGFPGTDAERPGNALRFAWAIDDDWRTAVANVRQPGTTIRVELDGQPSARLRRRARRDVERILSLDVDGSRFASLGRRDPVVRRLQRRYAGLRPVLFYTPYEAAAWAIVGHRIRMSQAAAVKRRLARELGVRGAFPDPDRLAQVSVSQRGLTDRKVKQLRQVARAAREGRLARDRLHAMAYDDAMTDLQELPGIGPFPAELILIRGVGDADALPREERRLAQATRLAYGLADDAEIEETAERWRPYRAWVALLLRAWLQDGTPST